MNGDQTDPTQSPDFFKGLSYLGKPTAVALTGQEPGGPAASLEAGGAPAPTTGPGGIGKPTGGGVTGGGVTGTGGTSPALQALMNAVGAGEKGWTLAKSLLGSSPLTGAPPTAEGEAARQAQLAGERAPFGLTAPITAETLRLTLGPEKMAQLEGMLGPMTTAEQAASWTPQEVQALSDLAGSLTPTGAEAVSAGGPEALAIAEPAAEAAGLDFASLVPGAGAALAGAGGLFRAITSPTDVGKGFGAAEAAASPLVALQPEIGIPLEAALALGDFFTGRFGGGGPSKAWQEFPSKVAQTAQMGFGAEGTLGQAILNAQTPEDLAGAVSAFKSAIGGRVGGYGEGTGPYELATLPSTEVPASHGGGFAGAPTPAGTPTVPDLQLMLNARLIQMGQPPITPSWLLHVTPDWYTNPPADEPFLAMAVQAGQPPPAAPAPSPAPIETAPPSEALAFPPSTPLVGAGEQFKFETA